MTDLREELLDEIEEIIGETHDIDVTDRRYAENILGWLERHHPKALAATAMDVQQAARATPSQDQKEPKS